MNTLQKIGNVTKNMRNARGLSQEQFCNLCGIDQHYISNIENGQRNLSIDVIERISKFFGLTLTQFFAAVEAVTEKADDNFGHEDEPAKREYISRTSYTHRSNHITDPQTSFADYIRRQGRSKGTVDKYSSNTPNCLDVQKIIKEVTGTTSNMYSVTDIHLLDEIIRRVRYSEFDEIGHCMYSAGLKKYKQYLIDTKK